MGIPAESECPGGPCWTSLGNARLCGFVYHFLGKIYHIKWWKFTHDRVLGRWLVPGQVPRNVTMEQEWKATANVHTGLPATHPPHCARTGVCPRCCGDPHRFFFPVCESCMRTACVRSFFCGRHYSISLSSPWHPFAQKREIVFHRSIRNQKATSAIEQAGSDIKSLMRIPTSGCHANLIPINHRPRNYGTKFPLTARLLNFLYFKRDRNIALVLRRFYKIGEGV